MIIILVSLSILLVQIHGQQTIGSQTFVINSKTGMLYPPSVPIFVKPGDHILLCPPPGLSRACYAMVNGTCMTLRSACVGKIISNRYPNGASLYFTTSVPTLYMNKVQPWPDPLIHCFILVGRHKTHFTDCVNAFSKYENHTETSNAIHIGPAYESLTLTAMPQVYIPHHVPKNARPIIFTVQIIFVLLTIPLFLMKTNITCTN